MAFLIADDIKQYATITSTSDDDLIDTLIVAAEQFIRDYTRRIIVPVTQTRRYRWSVDRIQGQLLKLDEDLLEATGIVNGNGVTVGLSDVFYEPMNYGPPYSLLRMKYSASVWNFTVDGTINVTGKWGYTDDPAFVAPHTAFRQAGIRLVTWLYRQRSTSADADRPFVTGDGITIMPSALPKDVLQLIEPHRRLPR